MPSIGWGKPGGPRVLLAELAGTASDGSPIVGYVPAMGLSAGGKPAGGRSSGQGIAVPVYAGYYLPSLGEESDQLTAAGELPKFEGWLTVAGRFDPVANKLSTIDGAMGAAQFHAWLTAMGVPVDANLILVFCAPVAFSQELARLRAGTQIVAADVVVTQGVDRLVQASRATVSTGADGGARLRPGSGHFYRYVAGSAPIAYAAELSQAMAGIDPGAARTMLAGPTKIRRGVHWSTTVTEVRAPLLLRGLGVSITPRPSPGQNALLRARQLTPVPVSNDTNTLFEALVTMAGPYLWQRMQSLPLEHAGMVPAPGQMPSVAQVQFFVAAHAAVAQTEHPGLLNHYGLGGRQVRHTTDRHPGPDMVDRSQCRPGRVAGRAGLRAAADRAEREQHHGDLQRPR